MANKHHDAPPLPSDRSFGITFAVVFAAIAAWLVWKSLPGAGIVASLSILFVAIALSRPLLLRPLNRGWMAFGAVLHRVVSPLVLGLIYFGMFAPIATAMRLRGRDAMRRRADPDAKSYWICRDPPGPPPESLKNQF